MQQQKILNGLVVQELADSIDGLKDNPELGKFKFRAKNKWIGGAHCMSVINDFSAAGQECLRSNPHILEAGEPEELLGRDKGPNATEALLHALASCLNASFIYHATAAGVKVDDLEFEMEGDIDINGFFGTDKDVRNGFESIRVICRVKADASPEKLQQLCELAQRRSPVFDTVTHPVPVSVELEILQSVKAY